MNKIGLGFPQIAREVTRAGQIVLAFIILLQTSAAFAQPKVEVSWIYYHVRGDTAPEIRADLRRRGPKGHWAYTTWHVRWNGACEVSLNIAYDMPKLADRTALAPDLLANWDDMIVLLKRHEETHGGHGIAAAKELVANDCRNANGIVTKWANEDKAYDKRTAHGRKEGIKF